MESAGSSFAAPASREDPDPRNRLQHVLATESQHTKSAEPSASQPEESGSPDEDQGSKRAASSKADPGTPMYTSTTTTTRRNANGSVSSVYSGNKIKHLKKEDGIPLWRVDIQYDFLKLVFEDDKKVFHKASDGTAGHTFADIYLDAMAKSSKCSKILKDKLLTERAQAVNMAMVCLLVNVGRMNTTLNCKSQIYTGRHAILTSSSFSRDACAASDVPLYPITTSTSRSYGIQATPGRATTQVDS
jgi:Ino eighty subunit 1